MTHTIRLASALALASALGACDSSSGPADGGQIRLNVATRAATPGSGPMLAGAPVEFNDSTNTLVIDKVELVVKEVELEQSEASASCEGGSEADEGGEIEQDDDCAEIESGPFLLDLPLSTGATTVMTVDVVPGTYEEFEFKVHAPGADSDFLATHPEFAGVSIRVTGTWNGAPFVYQTDLTAEQEQELVPPLVVAEVGTTDITLFIDIGTWFRGGDNKLIDPSSANAGGPNEGTVENNIRNSFDSFEDEDHDGCDDHDEGGDHGDGGMED